MKRLAFLLPFVFFAGCNPAKPTPSSITASPSATTSYTTADVAKHNMRSDCWIILKNNVYDVTKFGPQHPGGDKIYDGCGQDLTTFIQTQHKPISETVYTPYLIGKLQ
jgi:cytochrome b involved in lipid metabolism